MTPSSWPYSGQRLGFEHRGQVVSLSATPDAAAGVADIGPDQPDARCRARRRRRAPRCATGPAQDRRRAAPPARPRRAAKRRWRRQRPAQRGEHAAPTASSVDPPAALRAIRPSSRRASTKRGPRRRIGRNEALGGAPLLLRPCRRGRRHRRRADPGIHRCFIGCLHYSQRSPSFFAQRRAWRAPAALPRSIRRSPAWPRSRHCSGPRHR